jgi:anti-sigma regulatory factor (Ser/Thr protein kinase)
VTDANPVLSLVAELASLKPATEFAHRGAAAAGLPKDCWGHLDLVVEEIFVNVVRYAYDAGTAGVVELTYCVPRPGLLSFEIADRGAEYNPTTLREPNLPDSLNERSVGGLGVFLVRQLTESLDYSRDGEWNRLRFAFSAASAASAGR